MPTNTVQLSLELAQRLLLEAERAGVTPDEFIAQAVLEKIAQAEWQSQLDADAERRYVGFLHTGASVPWPEMSHYLQQRAAGEAPKLPTARKFLP